MRLPIILLLICFILRATTLGTVGITDPSEGRHATIAQTMYLTGDWITPITFDDGVPTPFLAKPPLQFWLTAASFHLFGVNEFASRVPSLLACILLTFALWRFAATCFSKAVADMAACIFVSPFVGVIFFGSCMIDPLLATAVGYALVSLPLSLRPELSQASRRRWFLSFFTAIAIGLLAKGPVALILVVGAIVPWIVTLPNRRELLKLPWVAGMGITTAIAAPWYLLAEHAHPGFLNYFIVHENFLRFLVRDYGDKYGSGHVHFRGMIWLMACGAFLPWTILLPAAIWRARSTFSLLELRADPNLVLTLAWSVTTLIFFTVSRQVSIYYTLPALPGLALLTAIAINRSCRSTALDIRRWCIGYVWLTYLGSLGCIVTAIVIDSFTPTVAAAVGVVLVSAVGLKFFLLPMVARESQPDDRANWVGTAALSLMILFTVAALSFSGTINGRGSTKSIVAKIPDLAIAAPLRLTFVGKDLHSSYFYLRLRSLNPFHISVVEEVSELPPGLAIISTKRWQRESDQLREHFVTVGSVSGFLLVNRK